jgi:hypothetical protein
MANAEKKEYGSRFLYAEDLLVDGKLKSPEMKIMAFHPKFSLTAANKKKIDKPSIEFQGNETKILVLAGVNCQVLHTLSGYHSDQGEKWVGMSVKLQARLVEAFGDIVAAVRIVPPVGAKLRRSVLKRLGKAAQFEPGKGFYE